MTNNIPLRTCVGCRKIKDKKTLVRIVNDNGVYQIDYEQKSKGRGAYVCKCADCIKNAFFKGGMDRSFRCSIPKEVANSLSEKLVKDIDGET